MKTIESINHRIKNGEAVVLTASEVKNMIEKEGPESVAREVDVVTTGTFSPMCSSGAMLNVGHVSPPLKMCKARLNGVSAYGGLAAVDLYIGATEVSEEKQNYGGAHVIYDLVKGRSISLSASGEPTDCYPGHEYRGNISLKEMKDAYLMNPRNCYQNYNAALNSSDQDLYTYMGRLKAHEENIAFAGSGEISPLINDPYLKTLGLGSRIFCCGGEGYITWRGTQSNARQKQDPATGLPVGPARTLAISVDLKRVSPRWIRPVFIKGYGISLYIALAVAIPVLTTDTAARLGIRNRDIRTRIIDYHLHKEVGTVDYESLIDRGSVHFNGRPIRTRTLSHIRGAYDAMSELKERIRRGKFLLTVPSVSLDRL